MTGPVAAEALVDKLAQHLAEGHVRGTDREDDFDWSAVTDQAFRMSFIRAARRIFGGPLAPLLAALQQVTAERDEARAKQAVPLTEEQLETRRNRAHEAIVRRLQSERDVATSELARIQAEGEAKDRRIAALEAALEPFAWFGEVATPDTTRTWSGVRHTERISTRFRHEHFRAARTALARAATAREGA